MLTSIIMYHQISWLPLIIPTKYTHLILNVLAPMAKDRSWWPRQIPNMGLYFSSLTTLLKLSMVALHIWGSPGPLLMNNPSYSVHKQHHSIKHLLTGIFKKLASSLNCLVSTKIFLVYILKKKILHILYFFFLDFKRLHKHIKLTCFTVLGFIHAKQTRLSFYTSKLHIIT